MGQRGERAGPDRLPLGPAGPSGDHVEEDGHVSARGASATVLEETRKETAPAQLPVSGPELAAAMKIGTRVMRGVDWKWGDQVLGVRRSHHPVGSVVLTGSLGARGVEQVAAGTQAGCSAGAAVDGLNEQRNVCCEGTPRRRRCSEEPGPGLPVGAGLSSRRRGRCWSRGSRPVKPVRGKDEAPGPRDSLARGSRRSCSLWAGPALLGGARARSVCPAGWSCQGRGRPRSVFVE